MDLYIESFSDNPRLVLFGLTKEILALELEHCRLWDRKNLNLGACYEKKTGKIASINRLANGDRSELGPMPEKYANHPGVKRLYAMNAKSLEREMKARPELFAAPYRVARSSGGAIIKEFRGSEMIKLVPILTHDALVKLGYTH
jgi:hypothetical protein